MVMEKGVYYDPGLANKLLASQFGEATGKSDSPVCELSTREQEVLTLCAWGHSNKEIAAKLDISVKTVETYRARVSEKLQLRSRTEMVRFALRQGWLKDDRLGQTTR
jgi:DNA-binding NarL/FixJ family response regulator